MLRLQAASESAARGRAGVMLCRAEAPALPQAPSGSGDTAVWAQLTFRVPALGSWPYSQWAGTVFPQVPGAVQKGTA